VNHNLQKTFAEVRQRHLCEVTLDAKHAPTIEGFIVDWSDSLVLMHLFDRDSFCLNGYCAVGLRFLRSFDHAGEVRDWMECALRKMRLKPVSPKRMNIADWGALITAIDETGRWFSLNLDRKRPGVFFVSKLLRARKRVVDLFDIGPDGDLRNPWTIQYSDISRICWGDGYTNAIQSVAPSISIRA
jgi:hypothetical protein